MSDWFYVVRKPVRQRARRSSPSGEFISNPSGGEMRVDPNMVIIEDPNGGLHTLPEGTFRALYTIVEEGDAAQQQAAQPPRP